MRLRFRTAIDPAETWIAALANALQQGQMVYLFGSLFIGIAFQPFVYMLIGMQIGLLAYTRWLCVPLPAPMLELGSARAPRARPA